MNDCMFWDGPHDSNGYAVVYLDGRYELVHRRAFAERHGPIPKGHVVHHVCEVRACINPDHLEALSRAEHPRRHPPARGARSPNRRRGSRCAKGHLVTQDNAYWVRGLAQCRECRRAAARRQRRQRCPRCERVYANIYAHRPRCPDA